MKVYRVHFLERTVYTEAESVEEATEKARRQFPNESVTMVAEQYNAVIV